MTRCLCVSAALLCAASAPAADVNVTIQGFAYTPAAVTIRAGETVRWQNRDSIEHTVTAQTGPGTLVPSGAFDSGLLLLDDTFAHTFTTPGLYHYYCIPHGSSMQATVRVLCPADVNASGAVNINDVYDFLSLFFSGGLTVQALFDFLAAYFTPC